MAIKKLLILGLIINSFSMMASADVLIKKEIGFPYRADVTPSYAHSFGVNGCVLESFWSALVHSDSQYHALTGLIPGTTTTEKKEALKAICESISGSSAFNNDCVEVALNRSNPKLVSKLGLRMVDLREKNLTARKTLLQKTHQLMVSSLKNKFTPILAMYYRECKDDKWSTSVVGHQVTVLKVPLEIGPNDRQFEVEFYDPEHDVVEKALIYDPTLPEINTPHESLQILRPQVMTKDCSCFNEKRVNYIFLLFGSFLETH